jgi:ABC-type phosphate transport system substrate-binding protein
LLVAQGWRAGTAAIVFLAATASAGGAQDFQVIVHPSVRGTKITRSNLSALFTGKTSQWGDKSRAMPVDQSANAPVRRAFTAAVLGLSMGELQMYWQRRVASDRLFPPPIRGTDQEVLDYVAATSGAIGYVAPDTALPESVRVIAVVD